MSDSLSVIKSVSHENEAIVACIYLIRSSNDNLKRTLTQTKNSGWTQDNICLLLDKIWSLKQYIIDVADGFKGHCTYEVDTLAPVIGDLMVEALEINHQEILQQLGEVRKLLSNIDVNSIKKQCYIIYQEINTLCQLVETHNGKEEGMLQLFMKLFETKSPGHLSPQRVN